MIRPAAPLVSAMRTHKAKKILEFYAAKNEERRKKTAMRRNNLKELTKERNFAFSFLSHELWKWQNNNAKCHTQKSKYSSLVCWLWPTNSLLRRIFLFDVFLYFVLYFLGLSLSSHTNFSIPFDIKNRKLNSHTFLNILWVSFVPKWKCNLFCFQ